MTQRSIELSFEFQGVSTGAEEVDVITGKLRGLDAVLQALKPHGILALNATLKDTNRGIIDLGAQLNGMSTAMASGLQGLELALGRFTDKLEAAPTRVREAAQRSVSATVTAAKDSLRGVEQAVDATRAKLEKPVTVQVRTAYRAAVPDSETVSASGSLLAQMELRRKYSDVDRAVTGQQRQEEREREAQARELARAKNAANSLELQAIRQEEREALSLAREVARAKNSANALELQAIKQEEREALSLAREVARAKNSANALELQAIKQEEREAQAQAREIGRAKNAANALELQAIKQEEREAQAQAREVGRAKNAANALELQAIKQEEREAQAQAREVGRAKNAANALELQAIRQAERATTKNDTLNSTFAGLAANPAAQISVLERARAEHLAGKLGAPQLAGKFGSDVIGLVSDADKYNTKLGQLRKLVQEAEEAHLRFGRTGHDVFRGLTSGVGAIWLSWGQILPMLAGFAASAGFRAMVSIGADLEHQMGIIRAVGQETSGAMHEVERSLLQMSTNSLQGIDQMTGGLKALVQAGFSAKDAVNALPAAMNLSTMGEVDPTKSALFLAGIRTTFKGDESIQNNKGEVDLNKAANITALTAAKSQTSIEQMMESMKQASTVADDYSLSLVDTSVSLQLLAQRNITGSAAGTALRNMMEDLTGRTTHAKAALDKLGVSLYDKLTGQVRPTILVLEDLRRALQNVTPHDREEYIKAFGTERSRKAFGAYLSMSDAEVFKARADAFRANENGGFVAGGAQDMSKELAGQTTQALNTLKATALSGFEQAGPRIRDTVAALKEFAGSREVVTLVNAFASGTSFAIQAVVGLTSATVKLTPAILGLGGAFAIWRVAALLDLAKVTAGVGTLVSSVRAGMAAVTAAMGANPIALTAAAIAAGAGVIYSFMETTADRAQKAKARVASLNDELARVKSDTYQKFNDTLGKDLDKSFADQKPIDSLKAAKQRLREVNSAFDAETRQLTDKSSQAEVERAYFVADRRRSVLVQQFSDYDRYLQSLGKLDTEHQDMRLKFLDKLSEAESKFRDYQLALAKRNLEEERKGVIENMGFFARHFSTFRTDKEDRALATGADLYKQAPQLREQYTVRLSQLRDQQAAGIDTRGELAVLVADIGNVVKLITPEAKKAGQGNNAAAGRIGGKSRSLSDVEGLDALRLDALGSLKAQNEAQATKQAERPKFGGANTLPELGEKKHGDREQSELDSLIDRYYGNDRQYTKNQRLLENVPADKIRASLRAADIDTSGLDIEGLRSKLISAFDLSQSAEGRNDKFFRDWLEQIKNGVKEIDIEIGSLGASELDKTFAKASRDMQKALDDQRKRFMDGVIPGSPGEDKRKAEWDKRLPGVTRQLEGEREKKVDLKLSELNVAETTAARQQRENQANQFEYERAGLDADLSPVSTIQRTYMQANAKRELELAKAQSDLQQKYAVSDSMPAEKKEEVNAAFKRAMDERRQIITAQYTHEVQLAQRRYDAERSALFGMQKAMAKYQESLGDWSTLAGDATTKMMSTLEQALSSSFRSIRLESKSMRQGLYDLRDSFGEILKQMVADALAKKAMLALTEGVINPAVSAIGSVLQPLLGSFMGSIVGGPVAGTAPGYTAGTAGTGLSTAGPGFGVGNGGGSYTFGYSDGTLGSGLSVPQFRATGGGVDAGKPYVVGEQGWELFIPNTDGTIVNNQASRNIDYGNKAGDTNEYNINIHIENKESGSTASNSNGSTPDMAKLGALIKSAALEVIAEQKRPGGLLSR